VRFCALVFATLTLWAAVAAGQNRPAPSRTPWGDPDLQGTWPGGPVFVVPFERAPEFGTRATLTAEELARRNAQVDRQLAAAAQGNFWTELGHGPAQTSLIVEPENGRLPPMTADGGRRAQEWLVRADDEYRVPSADDLRPYDRCITRGVLGSALPNDYGSGMQIYEASGVVVIRYEMVHEARVIPIDPADQSATTHFASNHLVHGRLARMVGKRHARRGDNELQW